jgi:hypothetical protein
MQIETLYHTNHSSIRMCQRGISQAQIELILLYSDQIEYAGSGAERLSVSKKLGPKLVKSGAISAKDYGRIKDIVLIVAGNDLLTIFHRYGRLKRLH